MTADFGHLRDRLAQGDRRTPGAAAEIALIARQNIECLSELIAWLDDADPVVASHAAHACMQISTIQPSLFDAHVETLIPLLEKVQIWEIGEQLPKVLVRCALTRGQIDRVAHILNRNLEHRSNIVAACSLQALIDLAQDGRIDPRKARAVLEKAGTSNRKALAARARKLLARLGPAK